MSRRFVAATAERLDEFRSRTLDDQRWPICFVDGFDFAGHTMIGALGVTTDGTKVPLGVVEGSTENASVVRGLIASLRDRGLDASEGILFVLDGAKALSRAVRDVFGDQAVIARCRIHKERNILDHLPEAERPWIDASCAPLGPNPTSRGAGDPTTTGRAAAEKRSVSARRSPKPGGGQHRLTPGEGLVRVLAKEIGG